jgi:hypothetical protein
VRRSLDQIADAGDVKMATENGLLVDLDEIRTIVQQADVFTASFRLFPERLLVDTRFDGGDPEGQCGLPMMAIVEPVASVQERFFWLGQHRPSLGMPKQFMFFYWPHSIRYLEESGVWAVVRERLASTGAMGVTATCDAAMEDLLEREHAAHVDAIKGEKFHTVWSR